MKVKCSSCVNGQAAAEIPCAAPGCRYGTDAEELSYVPETIDGRKLPAVTLRRAKVLNRWGWERASVFPPCVQLASSGAENRG